MTPTAFVIMKNNSIHSIFTDENEANQALKTVPGGRIGRFPLVAKSTGPNVGMTEAGFDDQHTDDNDDLDDLFGQNGDQDQLDDQGEFELEDDGVSDDTDVVCMDVPLTIRLLEYVREEMDTDTDLHELASTLANLSNELDEVLTMDHYDQIVGGEQSTDDFDSQEIEFGGLDDLDGVDDSDNEFGALQQPQQPTNLGQRSGQMYESSMTFGQYINTLAESDDPVPTVKDVYTKKKAVKQTTTKADVLQDKDTSAYKVADSVKPQ